MFKGALSFLSRDVWDDTSAMRWVSTPALSILQFHINAVNIFEFSLDGKTAQFWTNKMCWYKN